MDELKKIRVMQHDTKDQIRIGLAIPMLEDTEEWLDIHESAAVEAYEKKSEWVGGFAVACEKYYKRVALVDGETLEVRRMIYPKK